MSSTSPKIYKYYNWMRFKDAIYKDDPTVYECDIATNLFEVGLYVVMNAGGRVVFQISSDPKQFGRNQQKQIKQMDKDGIKYKLGREVRAYENEQGFWQEMED